MRVPLRAAVLALLAHPHLVGQKDVVRLGAVVFLAKAAHRTCRVAITARELGRWLGVHKSTIDHEVLPALRMAGLIAPIVVEEQDEPLVSYFRVMPLWEARGATGSPFHLQKPELATLLRFIEGLFAPGWGSASKTPPGLLAARQARGAATDRLALLLLALHARPDGRVPLTGGRLAQRMESYGRAVVTLARMLGCEVPSASLALRRLEKAELVVLTAGAVERLRVPAIAVAHRAAAASKHDGGAPSPEGTLEPPAPSPAPGSASLCEHCRGEEAGEAFPLEGDGWRQGSFEDLDMERFAGEATAHGVFHGQEAMELAGQTLDWLPEGGSETAHFHADHAPGAELPHHPADHCGFSGEAVGGGGDLPKRAGTREESSPGQPPVPAQSADRGAARSPLRGEKPDQSSSRGHVDHPAASGVLEAWRSVSGGPPPVWATVPKQLADVLRPVEMIWGRLDRMGTRWRVEQAVRAELEALRGVFGPGVDAERILKRRLGRRVADQGEKVVVDPAGWLIRWALPRRATCPDARCDDGRRMDTGGDCEACGMLHVDRRALRQRAAEQVAARLGVSVSDRLPRAAFEEALRQEWQRQGWLRAAQHERDAEARRAREAAQAARRAELEAAEAARRELPCAGCGRERAAGLCGICADARVVEESVGEAAEIAVAAWAHDLDAERRLLIARKTETQVRAEVEASTQRGRAEGAFVETVSLMGKLAAELALAQVRRRALGHLAWTDEARAEAESAYAAQMRRRHLFNTRADAQEAAQEASRAARWRTAEYLLRTRLGALRARPARVKEERATDPYIQQADSVRAQLRHTPPATDADRGASRHGETGLKATAGCAAEDPYAAGAARARAALAGARA
jgi:hypothetical protein